MIAAASAAFAQIAQPDNNVEQPAGQLTVTVTAAATAERVRFTAPGNVVRMQLQVLSETGEILFEVSSKGNVLDWTLQDSAGQRLSDGAYLCVVTVKSISGGLSQKAGAVTIAAQVVSLRPNKGAQLSTAQERVIGPIEDNSSLTIVEGTEPPAVTVLANDGTDGQMIRGRGALSFRIGNFFTGNDREQMRLTEEGNLGIGTSEPKTTLDVAGTIRAQRFLITKPKPVGTGVSAQDSLTANVTEPDQSLLTGSGTQDRIAKWLDNAGTLGDSNITEAAGNVGIGTTTPGSKLVVSSNSSNTLPAALGIARFADADGVQTAVFADAFGTNPIFNVRRANGTAASPSAVQANQLLGVIGASGYGASAYSGTRARVAFWASENWTNTANGTFLTFNTTANGAATAGGTERMRIDNAGNVGIGTTNPDAKLSITATGDGARVLHLGTERAWVFKQLGTGAGTALELTGADPNNNNKHFVINTDGNVGIGTGTTAPQAKLHVVGTTGLIGNVGIGTTAPQAKLQVIGNVKLGSSGQLFAPGGEENLRIIRGVVSSTGAIIAGSGFSVSHPATGEYVITFDTSFSGTPSVTATTHFATGGCPATITIGFPGVNTNSAPFVIWGFGCNAQTNEQFHFIVIGPR